MHYRVSFLFVILSFSVSATDVSPLLSLKACFSDAQKELDGARELVMPPERNALTDDRIALLNVYIFENLDRLEVPYEQRNTTIEQLIGEEKADYDPFASEREPRCIQRAYRKLERKREKEERLKMEAEDGERVAKKQKMS